MNFTQLLYEVHEYKNNPSIYDYQFNQFMEVLLQANITLMNYSKELNIPFLYAGGFEKYDYIEFDMNELIASNELFEKYGIIITNELRQVLHRKDKKHFDDINVTHVKCPLALLLDYSIDKNSWKRLEKTM